MTTKRHCSFCHQGYLDETNHCQACCKFICPDCGNVPDCKTHGDDVPDGELPNPAYSACGGMVPGLFGEVPQLPHCLACREGL